MIGKVLNVLTAKIVRISGQSMSPTLRHGSWVVMSRRAYRDGRLPARFDVVRLEDPSRPGHWIIKRVVGLPGEEVMLDGGRLLVDGTEIVEPHVATCDVSIHEWWLRDDELVVLGDNRAASTDSRKFGPVNITALSGRVGRRFR